MHGRIEGIVANIGGDLEKWIHGRSIVTAKYHVHLKSEGKETEFRTVFDPKNITMYVPDSDGGVKIIHQPSLEPQEYVFDAYIVSINDTLLEARDIVVRGVNK